MNGADYSTRTGLKSQNWPETHADGCFVFYKCSFLCVVWPFIHMLDAELSGNSFPGEDSLEISALLLYEMHTGNWGWWGGVWLVLFV